jgi:hypothetical protein
MKSSLNHKLINSTVCATFCLGTLLAGDGSDEAGFVAPPRELKKQLPPAPPRTVNSAETVDAAGAGHQNHRRVAKTGGDY